MDSGKNTKSKEKSASALFMAVVVLGVVFDIR